MTAIHIVDQIDSLRKLRGSKIVHEWESGPCVISADVAEKLIGVDLYIHERPSQSSLFGGKITGFRIDNVASVDVKIIFRFQATNEHRDVKTSRGGWANNNKIVW
jgi:hypothetical protein